MGVNVVVIAAIALLVLVIIALIVGSGGRKLAQGTQSCLTAGGKCVSSGEPEFRDARWEEIDVECSQEVSQQYCMRYKFS